MTIKGMNEAIKNYCDKRSTCSDCELQYVGHCFGDNLSDYIIEDNYHILFDKSDEVKDKETGEIIPTDPIKPTYYNDTKITPFDVIDDWDLNFYLGNAIKYIKRAGKKDGNSRLQDLQKVKEYIEHDIKKELEEDR